MTIILSHQEVYGIIRDEIDINIDDASKGKPFKYKTKVRSRPPRPPVSPERRDQPPRPPVPPVNIEVTILFKYLSNFWSPLDLKICVFSEDNDNLINGTFQINNGKLYVPVVTLSINVNTKFLDNLKQRFKRIASWNKYRSEITTQPKNNNLDYMTDPAFRNINTLYLSFKNSVIDPTSDSFVKY